MPESPLSNIIDNKKITAVDKLISCRIDTIKGDFLLESSANIYNVDDMILHSPLLLEDLHKGNIMENYKRGVYFLKGNSLPNTILKELIACKFEENPITIIHSSPNSLADNIEDISSETKIVEIDKDKYKFKKATLKLVIIRLNNSTITLRDLRKGKSHKVVRMKIPVNYVLNVLQ